MAAILSHLEASPQLIRRTEQTEVSRTCHCTYYQRSEGFGGPPCMKALCIGNKKTSLAHPTKLAPLTLENRQPVYDAKEN